MKNTTRIKISANCQHHWKAILALGTRKYMCTECSIFGFKLKDDPLPRVHEHSIEVSNYLLDQYIELVQPTVTYVEPEKRSGPKPGIIRMRADNSCAHDWIPAPEYSDETHPRLKCTKCGRVGRKWASTGEVLPFVEEYAASLRRYQIRKQHLEMEPSCDHDWELVPHLGTKHINRYECKKCKWLGYRTGIRVPIKVHTALSVDKIKSADELRRKELNGKEGEQKEGISSNMAEGSYSSRSFRDKIDSR
jgi:hypothetical protein